MKPTDSNYRAAGDGLSALRRQAEDRLAKRLHGFGDLADLSRVEMRAIIHELHVHQIEPEMQNEELRRAQSELGAARDRYADLFESAPIAYFTVAAHGMILEANRAASALLRLSPAAIVGKPLSRFVEKDSLPAVLADADQIAQVVANLAQNAVQAMPEGGRLILRSRRDGADGVELSVADTGPGIPRKLIPRLFEPLVTTKPAGVGLGLAVTKALVEAHGGTIQVHSEVGKGSVFAVRLPVGAEGS